MDPGSGKPQQNPPPTLDYAPRATGGSIAHIAGGIAMRFGGAAMVFTGALIAFELLMLRRYPVEDGGVFPAGAVVSLVLAWAGTFVSCMARLAGDKSLLPRRHSIRVAAAYVAVQFMAFSIALQSEEIAISALILWALAFPFASSLMLLSKPK